MQKKAFYLQKLFEVQCQLHDILIAASHGLNQFYLDPESWEVSVKQDESPVTTADHFCHQLLCEKLPALGFDIPILSEENTDEEMAAFKANPPEVYWLIDPLDGTSGFVHGTGHFAVNVALIYQTEPLAGWIAWPRTGLMCWAFGDTAFVSGSFLFDVVQPESLSEIAALRQSNETIIFSSSSKHPRKQKVVAEIGRIFADPFVYSLGAAVKFCAMFKGYGDFYPRLGGTCLWDLAAGQVLLRARGGEIYRLDGTPMTYDYKLGTLNPYFLAVADRSYPKTAELLKVLHEIDLEYQAEKTQG